MDPKRAIILYALARDSLYRAAHSDDDRSLDASIQRLREISDRLWDLGHELAKEEECSAA